MTVWCIVPSQGHLGESPFEAGSWTKSQFVAQASPWQPALRGSHVRVNVSVVAYSRVSRKTNILCYLNNEKCCWKWNVQSEMSLIQRLPSQFSHLIMVFVYVNAHPFPGKWWRSVVLNQYSNFRSTFTSSSLALACLVQWKYVWDQNYAWPLSHYLFTPKSKTKFLSIFLTVTKIRYFILDHPLSM